MKIFSTQWINDSWKHKLDGNYDSKNTVIYVFGCPSLAKASICNEIISTYPNSHIVGCSTSGEIFESQVNTQSISMAAVQFEKTKIKTACLPISTPENSFTIGRDLANQLNHPGLKALFILSEGIHINGTKLIEGISSIIASDVTISGGLAGDRDDFQKTWILNEGELKSNFVTMVGFYGDSIKVTSGSGGGWDEFGPERIVTKSEANILFELDNQPALTLYKKYLDDKAKDLPGSALLFPLSLNSDFQERKGIVRTVLSVDEESKSMTFAGDIPEGSKAQLMHANFDRLVDGAAQTAEFANVGNWNGPVFSIAISCVGRRLVLGERIEDETEAVLDMLPPDTHQIGFYSYGEISSGKLGTCDLHNQTMTLTLIAEN